MSIIKVTPLFPISVTREGAICSVGMNEREEAERWIRTDESAKEMLARLPKVRPFLLLPPLHRVPLRLGNVLELFGPSPSAKTQILIQVAINCILPKEWNGVQYGGLAHLVVFVDLDCRFDIMRFSQMLIHRIAEAEGEANGDYDKALYNLCLGRFLYVRCSNSFEFLQTLKTLHYRLKKEKEAHGVSVHLLMIDSIGAFHWVDRASTFLSLRENNRKKLFLQSVSEAVVQEIKKLLQVHPMLVIATKSAIFGSRYSTASNEVKGNFGKDNWRESCSRNVTRNHEHFHYREYMPPVWQSFVTHRILVRSTDDHPVTSNDQNSSFYLLEWLLPRLSFPEKIVVKDFVKHVCGGMGSITASFSCGIQVLVKIHFHPRQSYPYVLQEKRRRNAVFYFAVPERLTIFLILFSGIIRLAKDIPLSNYLRLRSIRSVISGEGPNTPKKPIGSFMRSDHMNPSQIDD